MKYLLVALVACGLCASCQKKMVESEWIPAVPDYQDSTQWYITNRDAAADVFYIISTETGDYKLSTVIMLTPTTTV